MTEKDTLRLYLRDRGKGKPFFQDDEIELLLEQGSIEAAAALGWLLKAGHASDAPTTVTIGSRSETRGQATESFNIAMAMHRYWQAKVDVAADPNAGVGRWMELRPDGGFVGELMNTIDALEEYFGSDISRLL